MCGRITKDTGITDKDSEIRIISHSHPPGALSGSEAQCRVIVVDGTLIQQKVLEGSLMNRNIENGSTYIPARMTS